MLFLTEIETEELQIQNAIDSPEILLSLKKTPKEISEILIQTKL